MLFVYNFGIKIYAVLIFFFSLFNKKARLWIHGRKNIFSKISEFETANKVIWFHFASLGEFEQGRPVLEKMKTAYPDSSIVITFFSPSGYEIRKNYPLADRVFYLPIDTADNARKFVEMINPTIAVFTKYEYWYHYFEALYSRAVPLYMISGIFRKSQPFFKWYGSLHRRMLSFVSHFFVQDESSKLLLENLEIKNVTVSGDTRFDRVFENFSHPKPLLPVEVFCDKKPVLVAGSTWPKDEAFIAALAEAYPEWKFIIAPHEISDYRVTAVSKRFKQKSVKFSELEKNDYPPGADNKQHNHLWISDFQVLIIDNIGMLSSLYQYGDIAYIGGGFGAGIHNTLEAAAFGLPVIFGPNYQKFREARDLIKTGAAFSFKNMKQLKQQFERLQNEDYRMSCSETATEYVQGAVGASDIILIHISKELNKQ